MTAAFVVFFCLYLAYALWENAFRHAPGGKRLSLVSVALQVPLFSSAAWILVRDGALNRDLVFLPVILAALVAGHVLFAVSVLVTDRNPREAVRLLGSVRSIVAYLRDDPNTLFRVFSVSMSEEVIYRAAAQPLFIAQSGSPILGIAVAAAAFCVIHAHFFRNPWPQSMEFAAFALVLGGVYFLTGSLIAVTVIHAVRNWEIAYLEHVIAQQESDVPAPAGLETTNGHA